jgi:hypothetical protein
MGPDGEGNRAASPVTTGTPPIQLPSPASRRPETHRLQREAVGQSSVNERELCMRFQIASNLVSLGFDQVKTESDAVVNKHMLKLLNSFIDAADALSPRLKSQVGVNDNTLANVLAARAQCRFAISQNGGLLERWCEKMLAFAQTQASEHAQDFSPQLASMLDAAEEIMEEVSDNLSDIRRAIPLKPDDMERALLGRKTNVAFAMMAQTMLLLRPLTLCTEACLRDVMGEQAAPLEMQEKCCTSLCLLCWRTLSRSIERGGAIR